MNTIAIEPFTNRATTTGIMTTSWPTYQGETRTVVVRVVASPCLLPVVALLAVAPSLAAVAGVSWEAVPMLGRRTSLVATAAQTLVAAFAVVTVADVAAAAILLERRIGHLGHHQADHTLLLKEKSTGKRASK